MGKLALTTDGLKARINPLGERSLFDIGGTLDSRQPGKYPTDLAEQQIEAVDRLVTGSLSEQDRRIVSGRIEGEIAVKDANAGQQTFTLAFHPLSDLVLYVDFGIESRDDANPMISGSWYQFGVAGNRTYASRQRADRLDTSLYSVNETTGQVTLTFELSAGQSVYADYNHTGGVEVEELRDLAYDILRAKIAATLPAFADRSQELADNMEAALNTLAEYTSGVRGLQTIDQVEFVPELETRQPLHGAPKRRIIDW